MRSTDPNWILLATKEEIQRKALEDVARWFVIAVFVILIGCAIIPICMPWGN